MTTPIHPGPPAEGPRPPEAIARLLQKTFDDRYRLLEVLAVGGSGVVYSADHIRIGKKVAVKVLDLAGAPPELFKQVEREARTVTLIGHPNIVNVLDCGQFEDRYAYMVMEWLVGVELEKMIRRRGKIPLGEALDLALQAAFALEAAHDCGVIHRDVKPANMFLARERNRQRVVKLLDFGVAEVSPFGAGWVRPSQVVGTAGYIAPEIVRNQVADPRTDVYSLGATLYHMLVGEAPFTGATPLEAVMKCIDQDPLPPSNRVRDLPVAGEVDELIARAMDRDPTRRYSSMNALRSALAAVREKLGLPMRRKHDQLATRSARARLASWIFTYGEFTVVELAGALDERSELEQLTPRLVGPKLQLQLGRISHVNSVGARDWMNWLGELAARGLVVTIHDCPPTMIRQANLCSDFFKRFSVVSFQVPWFCTRCDVADITRVFTEEGDDRPEPPACPSCETLMVLDDVEDYYFLFLEANRERRLRRRTSVSVPVNARWRGQAERNLVAVELSTRGAFICSLRPPPVNTRVELQFAPDVAHFRFAPIEARVAHVQRNSGDVRKNGFGVEFCDIDNVTEMNVELMLNAMQTTQMLDSRIRGQNELRTEPRTKLSLLVSATWGGRTYPGELRDLSMSGSLLRLHGAIRIAHGDEILLHVETPDGTQRAIRSQVVHTRRDDMAGTACGLRFVRMDPQVPEHLEQLLLAASLRRKM